MDFTNDEVLVQELKQSNPGAFRFLLKHVLPFIISVLLRFRELQYDDAVDIGNDAEVGRNFV